MFVVVIGSSGTIGRALVERLGADHDVVGLSRRSRPSIDLADVGSLASAFSFATRPDAVVCCAANAPLTFLDDDGFVGSFQAKLAGQVELTRLAVAHLADGGSITLTSGAIPVGLTGSAGGALANAGLDAFVRAAADEMPRGLRLNAVSPGWVRESLEDAGMDPEPGTPAREVAMAYAAIVVGDHRGQVVSP